MSKKKLALLVLFGGALPLILNFIGIPFWLSGIISLSVSCCIDAVVIYKMVSWLKPKLVVLVR